MFLLSTQLYNFGWRKYCFTAIALRSSYIVDEFCCGCFLLSLLDDSPLILSWGYIKARFSTIIRINPHYQEYHSTAISQYQELWKMEVWFITTNHFSISKIKPNPPSNIFLPIVLGDSFMWNKRICNTYFVLCNADKKI